MGRFAGKVGYVVNQETSPGIWTDVITEKTYFGDLLSNSRRYEGSDVNKNLVINNQVSILADPYAYEYFPYCKYVILNGAKWSVTNVTIERPRLILTLGGLYNG